jgi:hypothetical protein
MAHASNVITRIKELGDLTSLGIWLMNRQTAMDYFKSKNLAEFIRVMQAQMCAFARRSDADFRSSRPGHAVAAGAAADGAAAAAATDPNAAPDNGDSLLVSSEGLQLSVPQVNVRRVFAYLSNHSKFANFMWFLKYQAS